MKKLWHNDLSYMPFPLGDVDFHIAERSDEVKSHMIPSTMWIECRIHGRKRAPHFLDNHYDYPENQFQFLDFVCTNSATPRPWKTELWDRLTIENTFLYTWTFQTPNSEKKIESGQEFYQYGGYWDGNIHSMAQTFCMFPPEHAEEDIQFIQKPQDKKLCAMQWESDVQSGGMKLKLTHKSLKLHYASCGMIQSRKHFVTITMNLQHAQYEGETFL